MVIQKRLDYGFIGYQVPAIPRALRSARKRSLFRENQMHAFDLLAMVAGKLLSGEDIHHPNSLDISIGKDENAIVKKERLDYDKPLKSEAHDQGRSDGTFVVSNLVYENCDQNCGPKCHSAATLIDDKLANDRNENEMRSEKSGDYNVDCKYNLSIEDILGETKEVLTSSSIDGCKLEDPSVKEQKPCEPAYSKITSKVPLCRNHNTLICYPGNWDDIKVDGRDDDENSSGCTCTHPKSLTSGPYIGGQRIRKILASKRWKGMKRYRAETVYNVGGNSNFIHNYHKRKNYYCKRQRTQINMPFKKRKLFYSSSLEKATGTSSSVADRHRSFKSRDSYVKLRITSFRVPEIFFEIPATATVGSLKRRVMEMVASILGDELHVGVLVRGKKVGDDNKTLFQSGISRNDQLDSLGFTLEPHSLQTPTSICRGNSPCRLLCNNPKRFPRYYPTSAAVENSPSKEVLMLEPHLANLGSSVESEHDSAPSPIHISPDKIQTSKALVSVPSMAVETLAVVPIHRKPKQPEEAVPRRIRRPFTVAEVEALVQAVERLGTGRWRDVKLGAFDGSKHRTYVDLKDKWKTLVHTARIAPQQRRGEPVPQELLDRVLNAHDYWSRPQHHTQALPPPPPSSSPLKPF